MSTICGHEREALIWLLSERERLGVQGFTILRAHAQAVPSSLAYPDMAPFVDDVDDPAKLVKMLTEEAKRLGVDDGDRGNTSAVWFSFAWFKDGIEVSRFSWIFPRNEYGIRGICSDTWRWSFPSIKSITLPQARKLLSKWIQLPNMARKEAEQALRSES